MFHLQGIVFIAVLCAVNAAFTVNIYEDALDVKTIRTNKVHEVESCNDEACNSICRLVGFDSGTCVGDTCECRKNHKDNEQLEQKDIPSLEGGVIDEGLSGCDPNACYQLCRRLKFPSGTCINGRCKCDNFRQEPEQLEQNDIFSLEAVSGEGLSGCDPNACYQLCRRLKFPSGTCVNGRCKCDNFRQEPEALMENEAIGLVQVGCTNAGCSFLCHLVGYRYGVCVNGNTCKCSNSLQTEGLKISLDRGINEYIVDSVKPNVDNVVTKNVRDCDQLACVMGCRELGFPGGSCFLGKCHCNKRDEEDETLRSWQECNNVNCYFMCRRWGYIGGSCRAGSCLCV